MKRTAISDTAGSFIIQLFNFENTPSGLLAGSTTNPPAPLTFATTPAHSDSPTVAYATVYPLTMRLRILCAQVLTLILIR